MTVGFLMSRATAEAAREYPNVDFAIVDVAYLPGAGCTDTVDDCYSAAGGLDNVTSLMFAEDEVGSPWIPLSQERALKFLRWCVSLPATSMGPEAKTRILKH